MAKASDNLFPYVHLVPAAAPSSPASGSERVYLDSGDGNKLKRKNSSGTVTTIEGGSGSATFHGARIKTSASQSHTSGSWQQVTFDAEDFDTDAYHDLSTNTQRFTVPSGMGGKYLLVACISYAPNASDYRHASFMKNGSTRFGSATVVNASGSFRGRVITTAVVSLAAADYIHVEGYQASGSTLQIGDTTTSGDAGETWAAITYLGA